VSWRWYRLGACCYIAWGSLQLLWASAALDLASEIPEVMGDIRGRVAQSGWDLAWTGAFAIVVAAWLNWRNVALGYWLNLIVVTLTTIGFAVTLVLPGYVFAFEAATGPALWLAATVASTIGYLDRGDDGSL
jgi:hypothetical protein